MAKKSKIKVWFVSSGSDKKNTEPFDNLDVALSYTLGVIKKEHASFVSLESKDLTKKQYKDLVDGNLAHSA